MAWKAYITWPPYARRPFQSCPGILRRKPNSSPFVVTVESGSRILRRMLTTSGTTSALNYSVEAVMEKAFIMNIQMSSHLKKCEAIPEQEEIAPHLGTPTIPRPASGSIHLCITMPSTALSGSSLYSERLCPSHPDYGVRAS